MSSEQQTTVLPNVRIVLKRLLSMVICYFGPFNIDKLQSLPDTDCTVKRPFWGVENNKIPIKIHWQRNIEGC